MTDYVYIKTQAFEANTLTENLIPLKAVSVAVSVTKTIPSFGIPFSGLATGEAERVALDLGMAEKSFQINGFIVDSQITKNFDGTPTTVTMTAQEIAQLIASGVDSTGIAKHQNFDELVVLIESAVDNTYGQRGTTNPLHTVQVPLTFAARGDFNSLDNDNVILPTTDFPNSSTAKGVSGFVRSFNFTLSAETTDVEFDLQFEVATVVP